MPAIPRYATWWREAVRALLLAGLAAAAAPGAGGAQEALPDPFAGVQVSRLANGLTVWYRRFPGAAGTSLSLTIPSGSDRDPPGREELAHVVEHALFAGRPGLTQAQVASAIADLGGSFNASTSPERTVLWVNVAREHAGFALDWLYGLVAPRAWEDSTMPGLRAAVALEIGLAPRSLLGRVRDEFLLAPGLLPAGFWEREYGLAAPEYRRVDRYAALQRIGAPEVAAFLQQHYVPARMILLVSGDLDPAALARQLELTFGQLPAWPQTTVPMPLRLKPGATRRYFWNLREDAALQLGFRIGPLGADDRVRLLFAQQLLERRLMRRLRWGTEQAVYGVRTSLLQRGGAALLRVEGRTRPADLARARSVLADELERLRQGRYPGDEFAQDRAALDLALRRNQNHPAALRAWHADVFYDPAVFPKPPLLGTRFAAMDVQELAEFARRVLGPDREILTVERPLPLGQGGAALILVAAVALGLAAVRRWLLRPIDRRRLRYLARLRPPALLRALGWAAFLALLLGGGRLLAAGVHVLGAAVILPRESFLLQATYLLVALALATFAAGAAFALVPARVLVFDHELRIKYLAYRTRAIGTGELREVRLASFQDVWFDGRLLRTVPLAFGWRRPGVLVRTHRGQDWFLSVSDPDALAAALAHLRPPGPGPAEESCAEAGVPAAGAAPR